MLVPDLQMTEGRGCFLFCDCFLISQNYEKTPSAVEIDNFGIKYTLNTQLLTTSSSQKLFLLIAKNGTWN